MKVIFITLLLTSLPALAQVPALAPFDGYTSKQDDRIEMRFHVNEDRSQAFVVQYAVLTSDQENYIIVHSLSPFYVAAYRYDREAASWDVRNIFYNIHDIGDWPQTVWQDWFSAKVFKRTAAPNEDMVKVARNLVQFLSATKNFTAK